MATELKVKCEECGGYITSHDSCECGTTMQELLEDDANAAELMEDFIESRRPMNRFERQQKEDDDFEEEAFNREAGYIS